MKKINIPYGTQQIFPELQFGWNDPRNPSFFYVRSRDEFDALGDPLNNDSDRSKIESRGLRIQIKQDDMLPSTRTMLSRFGFK